MKKDRIHENINILIRDAEQMLNQENISIEEKVLYKRRCVETFVNLIKEELNDTISEKAKAGLEFRIIEYKSPILGWINRNLLSARDNTTYNANFFTKNSEEANIKKYVFGLKQILMGISFNLGKLLD